MSAIFCSMIAVIPDPLICYIIQKNKFIEEGKSLSAQISKLQELLSSKKLVLEVITVAIYLLSTVMSEFMNSKSHTRLSFPLIFEIGMRPELPP